MCPVCSVNHVTSLYPPFSLSLRERPVLSEVEGARVMVPVQEIEQCTHDRECRYGDAAPKQAAPGTFLRFHRLRGVISRFFVRHFVTLTLYEDLIALRRQAIPDQNPKSEYRNPKQTEKLESEL
jgi:hypothetical protein